MGDLARVRRAWERFGDTDPMWGVLAHPGKQGRWQEDEFFEHGRAEVSALFGQLGLVGVAPDPDRALDFGCGVGRLTFALAERFGRVDGVDISAPMIAGAERRNQVGDRCRFHVYNGRDLTMFADGTFSFVTSLLTLQHVPPTDAERYLAELVRVLRPGGVLAVQLPAAKAAPPRWPVRAKQMGRAWLTRAVHRPPTMKMHALSPERVAALLSAAGAEVHAALSDQRAGDWGPSLLHVAFRRA
jgi:SAM-dependent methyltransferase